MWLSDSQSEHTPFQRLPKAICFSAKHFAALTVFLSQQKSGLLSAQVVGMVTGLPSVSPHFFDSVTQGASLWLEV